MKDKIAKKNAISHHKEFMTGSNCAHCCGQFKEHFKNKQGGQTSKLGGPAKAKKNSHHVCLTDKCPIHPDRIHTWGDCYQNIVLPFLFTVDVMTKKAPTVFNQY
jgi:hypothetical protein